MKFRIGNVEIANQVVLAPMAGISNSAYRQIIKAMGAGLIYGEMVSDKAIVYDNDKTLKMLQMTEQERPIAQQIFGSDVDSFVAAAKKIESTMHPDIIDINMGCPVPKVAIKNQAGSSLLKDINKIKIIVQAVVAAVSVPVTVKIRSGWDEKNINAVAVAQVCEEAGAKVIAVHARTRSQGYKGKADWNIIKQVKDAVKIPVIGNGDITSCYQAKEMLDYTGCDAIMIGRGVLGNPWLIRDCVNYLADGSLPQALTKKEIVAMMNLHFNLLLKNQTEKQAVIEIRSHFLWYLKRIPRSKEYKTLFCQAKNKLEIYDLLDKLAVSK